MVTILPLINLEFFLEHHKLKKELRINRYVVPEYKIGKKDEFLNRLDEMEDGRLEALCEDELKEMIEELTISK